MYLLHLTHADQCHVNTFKGFTEYRRILATKGRDRNLRRRMSRRKVVKGRYNRPGRGITQLWGGQRGRRQRQVTDSTTKPTTYVFLNRLLPTAIPIREI